MEAQRGPEILPKILPSKNPRAAFITFLAALGMAMPACFTEFENFKQPPAGSEPRVGPSEMDGNVPCQEGAPGDGAVACGANPGSAADAGAEPLGPEEDCTGTLRVDFSATPEGVRIETSDEANKVIDAMNGTAEIKFDCDAPLQDRTIRVTRIGGEGVINFSVLTTDSENEGLFFPRSCVGVQANELPRDGEAAGRNCVDGQVEGATDFGYGDNANRIAVAAILANQ